MATVLGCGLGDAGERPRTRTALPPGVLGGDAADGTGADSLRARDGLGAPGQLPSGTFADAMEACQDELAAFDRTLLQPLFSVRCVGCHNSDGVAGGTRLVLELDPANLSANYDAAATVAATEVAGRSLLVLKPTGEHPDGHTGGTLIAPNSAERERLSAFVAQVKTHACDPPKESSAPCRAPTPGRRQLRRLSRSEYQASVEDLLGISSEAERRFAADTFVHGFDNSAEALLVGPLLADQIAGEAERLAALAMEDLGGLLPCEVSEGDACASEFVRSFGRRAYRRPLTDTEVERYMEVHRAGSQDGGFESGLELVLSTMLQAPGFLYRSEIGQLDGGRARLSQYEIASELAYALTGSTPDQALLDAAERGELVTSDQRRAQGMRLLSTPRGRVQVARFVSLWLDVERLSSVPKDSERFPSFDPELRAAMAEEIERFVEHVVFEGEGTLQELLTGSYTFVNERLAAFYGVGVPEMMGARGFGRVDSPDPERTGILTLGAVLATHARPDDSSPVHRGKLVRERILCQPLAPPPPGVVVEPPPVDPKLSVRERYAAHSEKEPCQSCHRLIDPIGLGFEHFDGVGRYREREGDHSIDATGSVVQSRQTDTDFEGAAELAHALGKSSEVRDCFVLQWFRYAYGLTEDAGLACMLGDLQADFAATGGDIKALLVATADTVHMVERLAGGGRAGTTVEPVDDRAGSDAPPGPGTSETPPAVDMPAPQKATYEVMVDSSWPTGHCDRVTVTNPTNAPLVWSVTLTIDGTISNSWNCTPTGDSGEVTFAGVDWNREIGPGSSAEFGYCVDL